MQKKHIEEMWDDFATEVLPNVPKIQRDEMRKAFYAGVVGIFALVMGSISQGDEITQADLDLMGSIQGELEEFKEEMLKEAKKAEMRTKVHLTPSGNA